MSIISLRNKNVNWLPKEIKDNENKQPFELCNLFEEFEPVISKISKLKPYFIQLGRKRRKYLKEIFDKISLGAKSFDENALAK